MIKRNLQNRICKLLQTKHLMSVTHILAALVKQDVTYNKTSVYRALEHMTQQGTVCKYNFGNSQSLYELQNDHHDHMICKKCGKILSTQCNYTQPNEIDDFKVDHHHLTLIGVCKKCTGIADRI